MGNDIDIKNFQISDGQIGGHDYVDLGLPSGIMWATCNIGALKPYELGDYFAWGGRFLQRKIIENRYINGEQCLI